jgi:tetratricopeptide (TPR) repeat protein
MPSGKRMKLSVLALFFTSTFAGHARAADNLGRGVQAYNQGRYKEAIQLLQPLAHTERVPGNRATALYYIGLSQQRLNNLKEAEASYRSAYQLYPSADVGQYSLQALNNLTGHSSKGRSVGSFKRSSEAGAAPVSGDDELKQLPNEVKIPFEKGTSRHLFVNGYINGRPARLMFDTGAEECFVSAELLRELNLTVPANAQRINIRGSVGDVGGLMAPMTFPPMRHVWFR